MKNARHQKILELIEKYDIDTQDTLIKKLAEEGYTVLISSQTALLFFSYHTTTLVLLLFFLTLEQLSNSNLPDLGLVTLQMGFHTTSRVMLPKGLFRSLLKHSSSHLSDLLLPSLQNLPLPVKATVHLVLPYHFLQTFVHTFPCL